MLRSSWAIGLIAIILIVGCSGAPSDPSSIPSAAPAASPAATAEPTPTAPPATDSPAASRYDGIWATATLTKKDISVALVRAGLDVGVLDEWRSDWDEIGHWMFEFAVGGGEWWQHELADGVRVSGWMGEFEETSDTTVVVLDDETPCQVTYEVSPSNDTLTVDLTDSDCPADDVALQTAMVEAAPFHLVEASDWTPPALVPEQPSATVGPSTSSERHTVRAMGTVDGAPLGFIEYLPSSYSEDAQPSPVLVFLHGSGESGDGSELQLGKLTRSAIPGLIQVDRWPDERPFVVLSPQHDDVPPNFCFESSEIDEFVRFALERYNADPARVYLTGLSCGATGIWNYLAEHGDELITAAVPIAGFGLAAIDQRGCDLGRTPIWAFHGARDENVPVHGDAHPLQTLRACTDPAPRDARLTVYPTVGHDAWARTYQRSADDDIYHWMLSHTR